MYHQNYSTQAARRPARRRDRYHHIALGLGCLDSIKQLRGRLLPITLGVVLDPAPEVVASLLHGKLRLPVELLVSQGGVGGKVKDITLSSGVNLVGEVTADDLAECLDDLKDGAATAGTQVPCLDAGLVLAEVVEGDEVTTGKIDNVDVVADGGAVSGGVVYPVLGIGEERGYA